LLPWACSRGEPGARNCRACVHGKPGRASLGGEADRERTAAGHPARAPALGVRTPGLGVRKPGPGAGAHRPRGRTCLHREPDGHPTRGRTCFQPGAGAPPRQRRVRACPVPVPQGAWPARGPAPCQRGKCPGWGSGASLGPRLCGPGRAERPCVAPTPARGVPGFPAFAPPPSWLPFSSSPPPARPLAPFFPASVHSGRHGRGRRVVGFVPAEPGVPESGVAGADAGSVQKLGGGRRGRPAAAGPRVSQRGGRGGLLGAGGERGVSILAWASTSGCRCCEHVQKYFAIFLFPHQGSGVAGLPVPASKACRSLPCFNRFAAALTARKCCPKSGGRRGGAARAEPGGCRGRGGPRRGAGRKSCE
jgi:hypothetical protein